MADDEKVVALERTVDELKAALKQMQDADTAREKTAAKAAVEDAEDDVTAAAKKAGLRPEQYRAAIQAAKRQAFVEDYGDVIDERATEIAKRMLDEIIEAAEEEDADEDKSGETPPAAKALKEKAPPAPPEDKAPVKPHWSERSISDRVSA